VEELLLIPGVTKDVYDTLKPHVTVFGDGSININSAGVPVIMSMEAYSTKGETITEEMAERVVDYRGETPFKKSGSLSQVSGFGSLGGDLQSHYTVKSTAYRVTITGATEEGLRKTITSVLDNKGIVQYWREM
jgi:type II secretory pathway component PulK